MTPSRTSHRRLSPLLKAGIVLLPIGAVALWAAYAVPSAISARRAAARQTAANPYFKPYANPYPRTQNGFRFVAAFPARTTPVPALSLFDQIFGRRDFWNEYGQPFPTAVIALPHIPGTGISFQASARASTGETVPLSTAISYFQDNTRTEYAEVPLPWPGVPASYRWIDLTFADNQGKKGTWRITDLARLDHAVLPSDPLHTTETVQGLQTTARAWWDAKAAPPIRKTAHSGIVNPANGSSDDQKEVPPIVAEVKADVPKSAFTRPNQEWRVKIAAIEQEWDVSQASPSNGNQNRAAERLAHAFGEPSAGGPDYDLNTRAWYIAQAAVAPNPAAQRVARINAHLTKTETLTETIVFRNVPLEPDNKGWRVASGGAALTTPSGVRVQLSSPTPSKLNKMSSKHSVALNIAVSPKNGPLPNSPLQQTVGAKAPIRVTCDIPNSRALSVTRIGSENGSYPTAWLYYDQPIANPVLPLLTVTVTQEAQIENAPLTFIVPVKHGAPTEKWSN